MEVDITWSIIQFHGRDALLTMANDVTELKPATEMLKKNEARLTAAQRIANLGNWELDLSDLENLDRNKLLCSDETLRILGLRPGKAPTANEFFFNPVHPEDLHRVKDALKKTFRTKEPYEIEHRIMLPDGHQRLIRTRGEFVLDNRGKPVQLRGIVMDVSGTRPDEPATAGTADKPRAGGAPKQLKPSKPVKKPGAAGRAKR